MDSEQQLHTQGLLKLQHIIELQLLSTPIRTVLVIDHSTLSHTVTAIY